MVNQILSNIPRGLPGSLSGRSMDELAEELASAQFAEIEDGDRIVRLGKKWYSNDRLATPINRQVARRSFDPRHSAWRNSMRRNVCGFGDPKQADTYIQPYR